MVRQYRIERLQGAEVLVCEVYDRYLWSSRELEAFEKWRVDRSREVDTLVLPDDFRVLLDEWCDMEHSDSDTFYGLREPIHVINPFPSIVLRGVVVGNRFVEINLSFVPSVTVGFYSDEFYRFSRFITSPHWRNTVSNQLKTYGSLFESVDDKVVHSKG